MSLNHSESIFIYLNQKVVDEIIEEAHKWIEKETGGMMFGKIKEKGEILEIIVEKTYIPLEKDSLRNNTYFEINPDSARVILGYEKLLYLGNWHKHLGYGGPSLGDHNQIEEFFDINPHKNLVISLIIDFFSRENYEIVGEVYRRKENFKEDKLNSFSTFKVPKNMIIYHSDEESLPEIKRGIMNEHLDIIKQELVEVFKPNVNLKDINEFAGSTTNEKIISFPFEFKIKIHDKIENIDLLVLISFPSEFPEGQIYIDISSQDLSKNFTIDKHPANVLYEKELIQPFFLLLKSLLEDEITRLLNFPLWKVMREKQ